MIHNRILWFASLLVLIASVSCLHAVEQNRFEVELHRPVAVVVDRNAQWMFVANNETGTITTIDLVDHSGRISQKFAEKIQDLVAIPESDSLLAITQSPNRCLMLQWKDGVWTTQIELDLSIDPQCFAISRDQRYVCVSDRWNQRVCVLECMTGESPRLELRTTVDLPFMPKEVLALDDSMFCIADAFEGRLAIVDAMSGVVQSKKRFHGHHIGGLAYHDQSKMIWVTHQILSKVAHTSRDDIHWGSLIQNVVRGISLEALQGEIEDVGPLSSLDSLGDVGKGEADPCGVLVWKHDLVIAASGANHLLRFKRAALKLDSLETSRHPTRVSMIGTDRVAVVCKLSNTVEIVRLQDFKIIEKYSYPNHVASPVLAGEIAFHDAALSHDLWMSCNSCHVDGHTPNLLADTFGDESFGGPKRIPSLLGNFETAPFGWYGNKLTIQQQIMQTLDSTMHGPQSEAERKQLADQLAAYLKSLDLPPRKIEMATTTVGQALFESQGCSKCHQAANRYTSKGVYDVGVRDELGHREFNPPSLVGVGMRRKFMHDGRYGSLRELLDHHPTNDQQWNEEEAAKLIQFLERL